MHYVEPLHKTHPTDFVLILVFSEELGYCRQEKKYFPFLSPINLKKLVRSWKKWHFLYKGLVFSPARFCRSQVAGTKIFLAQGNFFMREFVFFSQQTNPQYKKITFYTQYRSYFIGSRTKTCFALCPDSFGRRPVSRDFFAFKRPDGLSQAKKSLKRAEGQVAEGQKGKCWRLKLKRMPEKSWQIPKSIFTWLCPVFWRIALQERAFRIFAPFLGAQEDFQYFLKGLANERERMPKFAFLFAFQLFSKLENTRSMPNNKWYY